VTEACTLLTISLQAKHHALLLLFATHLQKIQSEVTGWFNKQIDGGEKKKKKKKKSQQGLNSIVSFFSVFWRKNGRRARHQIDLLWREFGLLMARWKAIFLMNIFISVSSSTRL